MLLIYAIDNVQGTY